ncbi:MAG: YwbE family protein [Deltaproteobacteria bacterium]
MKDPRNRADVPPGTRVMVVQKQHQPTGQLTEGIVADLLTNSAFHPRGIKVRLTSGIVGRVQKIIEEHKMIIEPIHKS